MKRIYIMSLLLCGLLGFTACSDGEGSSSAEIKNYEESEIQVDVILPKDVWNDYQNAVTWAQENIEKAQQGLAKRVKLKLNWVDEDNTDLQAYGRKLKSRAGSDTVQVIIGPYHSSNDSLLLPYCVDENLKMPLIAPSASSAELQRIYAGSENVWFLTESDITQCEIMLTTAKNLLAKQVVLYYSNDNYGLSFRDWFGYQATELSLDIAGIKEYKSSSNLGDEIGQIATAAQDSIAFLFALSSEDACIDVCKKIEEARYNDKIPYSAHINFLMTDVAASSKVIKSVDWMYGLMPSAAPRTGFNELYDMHYNRTPYIGESQFYDALTMIALGGLARAYGLTPTIDGKAQNAERINEQMRALVTSSNTQTTWDADGLNQAAYLISRGYYPDITGASSDLEFDVKTHTKALSTTYAFYVCENGITYPLRYLSTAGTSGSESTESIWQWDSFKDQIFNEVGIVEKELPRTDQRWAIVASSSNEWKDYRHQADAFAMYSMLIDNGYDPDHIILIVEDNLAYDSRNQEYAGKIFIENNLQSEVKRGVTPDYKFSSLQPDDIRAILNGEKSERLPKVIESDADDNVLFFWSGHGVEQAGMVWSSSVGNYYTGAMMKEAVQQMSDNNRFRRMMLAIETCFSGLIGQAIEGIPNVIALTAANAYETSKADVYSSPDGLDLGVYLSNAFARKFRSDINENHKITIHDLWYDLAKLTKGSHVTLYNYRNYGSTTKNDMSDYFK